MPIVFDYVPAPIDDVTVQRLTERALKAGCPLAPDDVKQMIQQYHEYRDPQQADQGCGVICEHILWHFGNRYPQMEMMTGEMLTRTDAGVWRDRQSWERTFPWIGHHWLELDGFVMDPTAAQFGYTALFPLILRSDSDEVRSLYRYGTVYDPPFEEFKEDGLAPRKHFAVRRRKRPSLERRTGVSLPASAWW